MAKKFRLIVFLVLGAFSVKAQDVIPKEILLWPNGAPGSEGKTGAESMRITDQGDHVITNVNNPSITPYFPAGTNTGAAIIVVPGGGHSELWITHEGYNPAKWFAAQGITCFVLKYRLAKWG
jgi:acetyl esterase/lipase